MRAFLCKNDAKYAAMFCDMICTMRKLKVRMTKRVIRTFLF